MLARSAAARLEVCHVATSPSRLPLPGGTRGRRAIGRRAEASPLHGLFACRRSAGERRRTALSVDCEIQWERRCPIGYFKRRTNVRRNSSKFPPPPRERERDTRDIGRERVSASAHKLRATRYRKRSRGTASRYFSAAHFREGRRAAFSRLETETEREKSRLIRAAARTRLVAFDRTRVRARARHSLALLLSLSLSISRSLSLDLSLSRPRLRFPRTCSRLHTRVDASRGGKSRDR